MKQCYTCITTLNKSETNFLLKGDSMNDLNALAISKIAAKAARENLAPGVYDIDTVVAVVGTLTIGEDYDQRITAAIPALKLLGVALSKLNGVTIASLLSEIDTIDEKQIKAQAQKAVDAIKDASTRTCKGKVTHKLDFEEMELTS